MYGVVWETHTHNGSWPVDRGISEDVKAKPAGVGGKCNLESHFVS